MLKVEMARMPTGDELKRFSANANAVVLVGYPSGKQHTAGSQAQMQSETIEMADLARRLSVGDWAIPPRPFIEDGLREKADELKKCVKEQVNAAKNGKANWNKVGTMAVGAVQALVRSDYYKSIAPNSPVTIALKSTGESNVSDTPLIDTGDMINSLEYVVEKE